MPRQKKFKKIKLPAIGQELKEKIARHVIIALVIAIFLAVSFALVRSFFYRSDYFCINNAEVRGVAPQDALSVKNDLLRAYQGKNIFKTNLNIISRSLIARFPDAKDIIVKRALPDKLLVELNFRKPVAMLNDSRNIPVDRDGFLLTYVDPRTVAGLPTISGIDTRYDGRMLRHNETRNLKLALNLLDEVKKAKLAPRFQLTSIDAGDIKNMAFFLNGGLEIKIGYENFKDRLALLRKTLKNPRILLDRIKYIDLRFGDIVVSPK